MKTNSILPSVVFISILTLSMLGHAQNLKSKDQFIGRNLEEIKEVYQRAIKDGDQSYTILYAEALFYSGHHREAADMYEKADEAGLVQSAEQQRNFVHAARHAQTSSVYFQDTGYFSREWETEIDISPFCGNSSDEDFAPFYWNSILFIASSRGSVSNNYAYTQKPFINIHAFIQDCIRIDIPDLLPDNINTPTHDGPLCIAKNGELLIITRNHKKASKNGIFNLYLDYYEKEDGKWSNSKSFPLMGIEFSVQHPFYSDKDSLLYFSSNIEGGFGGFDLYKSKWDGRQWSEPINLGPEINSIYDEVFPSIAPQGDLVYSSNHIETHGGLDLVWFHNGVRYLFPSPFNTVHDDFSITFKNERSGFFASNRDRKQFNDDIYLFEIEAAPLSSVPFYVKVIDAESREPIEGVDVSYFSRQAAVDGQIKTSEAGMGLLHQGRPELLNYTLHLHKDGYAPLTETSKAFEPEGDGYVLTLVMDQPGQKPERYAEEALAAGFFVVYFDNDRPDPSSKSETTALSYQQTYYAYQLRKPEYYQNSISSEADLNTFFNDLEKGMEQLRWLASYLEEEMEQGNHYTIIFSSHASPLATFEYNMTLSKRRFASVENHIKSWQQGKLTRFIEQGILEYENTPLGALRARSNVSADRQDPSRSVYSVEAARERRVTISWRRSKAGAGSGTDG